jgi:hypothetical protein
VGRGGYRVEDIESERVGTIHLFGDRAGIESVDGPPPTFRETSGRQGVTSKGMLMNS